VVSKRIVITLPIDLSSESDKNLAELEERGIRGRYVSVEHIHEVDGDRIEWRRVACTDPGGWIPKFWAKRKVLSSIVQVFFFGCFTCSDHGYLTQSFRASCRKTLHSLSG
jgi:hypothetical protein